MSAAHRFGSLHRFGDALQRGARFGQENATCFCEPDGFGIVLDQSLKTEDTFQTLATRDSFCPTGARRMSTHPLAG